jgi:hypothetical protein
LPFAVKYVPRIFNIAIGIGSSGAMQFGRQRPLRFIEKPERDRAEHFLLSERFSAILESSCSPQKALFKSI